MKKKLILIMVLFLMIALSGCGNRVDLEEATTLAIKFVEQNLKSSKNEVWYVSGREEKSKDGNWIIYVKLFGYECMTKVIYINYNTGAVMGLKSKTDC